jgi:hypothetical protein
MQGYIKDLLSGANNPQVSGFGNDNMATTIGYWGTDPVDCRSFPCAQAWHDSGPVAGCGSARAR